MVNRLKYFTIIPNTLVRKPNLKNGPFRVLCYLMSRKYGNKKVFVSHRTIAKELGVRERTVINNLNELKKMNLVGWEKRGYGRSNIYNFNTEKYFTNEDIDDRNFTSNVKIDYKSNGNKFHTNNKENNNISNNKGMENLRELVNSWRPNIKQVLDKDKT